MLVRGNLPWIGLAVNHVTRDGAMGGHTRGEEPDGAGDLREQHDGLWRIGGAVEQKPGYPGADKKRCVEIEMQASL